MTLEAVKVGNMAAIFFVTKLTDQWTQLLDGYIFHSHNPSYQHITAHAVIFTDDWHIRLFRV